MSQEGSPPKTHFQVPCTFRLDRVVYFININKWGVNRSSNIFY